MITALKEKIDTAIAKALECLARDPKRAERLLGDVKKWSAEAEREAYMLGKADAERQRVAGNPVAYRVSDPAEPDIGSWLSEDKGATWQKSEPLYAAPQASADVRNAALEEAELALRRYATGGNPGTALPRWARDSLSGIRALKSAPAAESCRTDVCQAAQRDGVLCADDECDIGAGIRSAEDFAKGAGDVALPWPEGAQAYHAGRGLYETHHSGPGKAPFSKFADIAREEQAYWIVRADRQLRGGGNPNLHHYGDVLQPFAQIMADELLANAGKGDRPGWLSCSADALMLEVYYHAAKLQKAVKDGNGDGIREHSADVANLAMMVLDVCGGIDATISTQQGQGGA